MSVVEPIKKKCDIKKVEQILKKQCLRNLLLFDLGINCGLRISDILNLNVGCVKNKKIIRLYEQKTGKYKQIPMNYKIKFLVNLYTNNRDEKEPLFITNYNNRMDRVTAYRIIYEACKKANIDENIGTHSLRKTFGYHFYKKYNDIVLLQKIFNHSSPNVTLRYIGLEQEQINEKYLKFVL